MGIKISFGFLITFVAIQINGTFAFFIFRVNMKLEGTTFRTLLQVSANQCWEECRSRPKCLSFNYLRRFRVCELNALDGTYQLLKAEGCVFSDQLGVEQVG